ncbi:hypothetical protein ATE69_11675 [Sphingopyxis sp. H071]|nr:hypothetical protein ATE69_11675 [Sphingopyxis sp. H071]
MARGDPIFALQAAQPCPPWRQIMSKSDTASQRPDLEAARTPDPRAATEERIDHALEDSFPASDPPAANVFD